MSTTTCRLRPLIGLRAVEATAVEPTNGTDPKLMERLQRQVLGGATEEVVDTLVAQTGDGTNDVVAAPPAQARNEGEASAAAPYEGARPARNLQLRT